MEKFPSIMPWLRLGSAFGTYVTAAISGGQLAQRVNGRLVLELSGLGSAEPEVNHAKCFEEDRRHPPMASHVEDSSSDGRGVVRPVEITTTPPYSRSGLSWLDPT